jgi:gamma-glutamyl hydrolase
LITSTKYATGNVNGLLFPGGGANLDNTSAFAQAGKVMWDYVIKTNNGGEVFPVWATCMGFQQVCKRGQRSWNFDYSLH